MNAAAIPTGLDTKHGHKPFHVLKYKPQGNVLRQLHRSDKFCRIIVGPLGSGKTQASIVEMLYKSFTIDPCTDGVRRSRWLAVRNTLPDLLGTTIKDVRQILDGMGLGEWKMSPPISCSINTIGPDGLPIECEIMFRSFDTTLDEKKARGMQLTGCWFNETKELNKQNLDMLMSRVGRFPRKIDCPTAWFGVIGDSNAPDSDHWLGKMILQGSPENWEVLMQPGAVKKDEGVWSVNPKAENLANLPDAYYSNLVSAKKEDWIRANLANELVYVTDGRPVHPSFNHAIHVKHVFPNQGQMLYIGVDFGRTPAAVFAQRDINGSWNVLDEIVTENTSAYDFGRIVSEKIKNEYAASPHELFCDPAGLAKSQATDDTPILMLEKWGLTVYPAPSNKFEARKGALDSTLSQMIEGETAIRFDPKCKTLVKGLSGAYQFSRVQVSGDERYRDAPTKNFESHVCEALHYMLLSMEGQIFGAGVGWDADMTDARDLSIYE